MMTSMHTNVCAHVDTSHVLSKAELHVHHQSTQDELRWTYIGQNVQAWRTAHYEARKQVYGGPAVIVIAYHPKIITSKPPLYCELTYSNGTRTCLPDQANWFEFLRSTPKKNEIYVAYNLMWRLPAATGAKPKSVRVSTNVSCTPSSADILLFNDTLNRTGTIGLCLHKALFKIKDPQRVAAWIELNLAMGIELITLYYQSVSPDVEKAVEFYVKKGKVEAIEWKINISDHLVYNTGQLGTIQDCFYRNYHRFKYISFHDIDEVIVPHKHESLQQMMKILDKDGKHISYFKFYNSFWHDVGEIIEGTNTTRLGCPQLKVPIYFRSTRRTSAAQIPKTSRHKIILKPEGCYRIDIHNVKSEVKGYKRHTIDIHLGLMHHYRLKLHDDYENEEQVTDYTVAKYASSVMNGLLQHFCHIDQSSHE